MSRNRILITDADTHHQVIAFLETGKVQTLKPRLRREAKLGYEYPDVVALVKPETLGGEIFTLEDMAQKRLLDRIFFDAIRICPTCGHHDVNFRDACPSCQSTDLEMAKFAGGLQRPPLSGGGLDDDELDKSLAGLYIIESDAGLPVRSLPIGRATAVCNVCKKSCAPPGVMCLCMNCASRFEVSKALTRKIYSYKMRSRPSKPREAKPPAANRLAEMATLAELFICFEMAPLDAAAFLRQVELQVENARPRNSKFSLIGLHLQSLFGDHLGANRARELLGALKSILRRFDVLGIKSQFEWMILLPETPFSMAKILAGRLYVACDRLAWEQPLDLSLASYPEDGVRAEELLEILELSIVTIPKV
jgi:hypothetical protein